MNLLLAILFGVLLAGAIVGLRLQYALYSRLRVAHPKVLLTLAESGADVLAFPRFLWRRQYVGLADATFTRRADWLRRYWQVFFVLFLLTIAVLAATTIFKP